MIPSIHEAAGSLGPNVTKNRKTPSTLLAPAVSTAPDLSLAPLVLNGPDLWDGLRSRMRSPSI
jgi:hypothetical protein